jgi:hypothetical protein
MERERTSRFGPGGGVRTPTAPKPAPKPVPKPVPRVLKLESKSFPANNAAAGEGPHRGTGTFNDQKTLVAPFTVGIDPKAPLTTQLTFLHKKFSIRVMSFEIATPEAPNWFGVSFRKNIQAFDSVQIFCHPHPGNAGMEDKDYGSRGGRWTRLFRYAEMFGIQMAVADSNLIAVVPFFNNASYGSTGLFGPNWQNIIEQILVAVRQDVGAGANLPAAGLKNVVLSDFSRGLALMHTVRANCVGMSRFLREIWDFDGTGGAPPTPSPQVRVIHYDQKDVVSDANNFHVPAKLWVGFHGPAALSPTANVHSNIPDMVGWHAAEVSKFGR